MDFPFFCCIFAGRNKKTSMAIDLLHPMSVCRASAGTGKTFTLAAYYVGLLLSGESYRNILAVTFTNKATAEMKERILGYLYAIAQGTVDPNFLAKALDFGGLHTPMSVQEAEAVAQRADRCFRRMLLDYDNVQVSTIDSFLQTLLSGMAKMLDKGAGFGVELNLKQVITTAVDRMLTTDMDESLRTVMGEYMQEQLQQESRWDVRGTIIEQALELFKEQVQMLVSDGQVELDEQVIKRYRQALKRWQMLPEMQNLANMVAQAKQANEAAKKPNATYANAVARLERSLAGDRELKKDDYFSALPQKTFEKTDDPLWKAIQAQAEECRKRYWEYELTGRCLSDMRLMKSLLGEIERLLQDENRMLLAKTASTLRDALKAGDADFILEKAGIRYKHIMIDEFQDTSTLQWQVFRPLIEDVLAGEGHTLLIVGDIKQSIYRWRNGDWHIMAELGTPADPFAHYFNTAFAPLVRNFRSRRNVVAFNLATMQRLCGAGERSYSGLYDEGYQDEGNLKDFYNTKNDGGLVRVRAYPKHTSAIKEETATLAERTLRGDRVQRDILADMFATIEQLLREGERPSDIMILVRTNKQAEKVVQYYHSLPWHGDVRLVSNDSFRLEQSQSVLLIVNGLRAVDDPVAKRFVELNARQADGDRFAQLQATCMLPLYEQVQAVVRLLLCDAEGNFAGDDAAYVNCFLDKVMDFVATEGSDRAAFLQYWSDKMHEDAISAPEANAMRIMTIHSSKGLESKTLFIPFCNWPMVNTKQHPKIWCDACVQPQGNVQPLKKVPIPWGKEMEGTAYDAAYKTESEAQEVDSLNMLYVALTRAADNLYIYTDQSVTKKRTVGTDHAGALLIHACGLEQPLYDAFEAYSDETQPCYAEYLLGEAPCIHRPKREEKGDLFSFRQAAEQPATLQSNSGQVRFRQSQESMLYGLFGAERAEKMIAHINIGNLCHDILAHMETRADQQPTIDAYTVRGVIGSEEQRAEVEALLDKAWENESMCRWFDGTWDLLREQAVLVNGEEKRPDRVMLRGDKAIVLDYKFGARDPKYHKQVRGYMEAMRLLGYPRTEGYLWYAQEGVLEPVNSEE